MKIHKEGYKILLYSFLLFLAIMMLEKIYLQDFNILFYFTLGVLSIFYILIIRFFRVPLFTVDKNDNHILCPANGKVVVIEEVEETEYFKDKRLQISVFMSPNDVHVNRYSMDGNVIFSKYHPGKFLVAWHPKSSTENERTTIVVENKNGIKILTRQIAGFVARRIVCYAKAGDTAIQGNELGFIKFGSRVDLFLPLDVKVNVSVNQKVVGGKTIIASFK
ncbi:MAG: phosphatidylserine decarboxylase family protein [Bacteroidetes bacterium]|nr:phosphatidylserine decarboxylase family protein [Bacteroidota bacterium]